MRVAMYYRNSDVRIEEMPRPEAGPGEMLVKAAACGICGSDVLEWYRMKKAPLVLGHEMAGEVVEVGDGVGGGGGGFSVGDRVFVSHHVACGTCRRCRSGHATACETLHTTNYDPGGFAEFVRVPQINVERGTFRLPDGMSYDDATFIEPVACVLRGQRALGVRAGDTVLVLGSGLAGLLHIVLSKLSGAGRVIATDVSASRLAKARELGADVAIDASGGSVVGRVQEANGGELPERVVLCTGAAPAVAQALEAVDRGGVLLFFAVPTEDVAVPMNRYWRNDVTIRTSYAADGRDIAEAIDLISAGNVPTDAMVTHRLPLGEVQRGFDLMSGSADGRAGEGAVKVVIHPGE